jgi:gamma-glutamylcyclotransferase
MNDERLYFAYGSNINLDQMAFRCPNATVLMPVVLSGYELTYRGGGVATVVPKKDSEVLGLMWSITPECEKSLDRYEGYPNFYHKTDVAVTDPETGKIYHVMMYEMDEKYKEPSVPSSSYFGGIVEGYIQNNMDTRPLFKSLKRVERETAARQEYFFGFKPYGRNLNKNKPKNRGHER